MTKESMVSQKKKNKPKAVLILVSILVSMMAVSTIPSVDARKYRTIIPDIAWFDYCDMSIRWRADVGDYNVFMIDLDGDHTTVAVSEVRETSEYGKTVDVGVAYIYRGSYGFTLWFEWEFTIGTLKIDRNPTHPHYRWIVRSPYGGEYFGFALTKTHVPSNFIVVIHASDGRNMLPIRSTFWYSTDIGMTWKSFTPSGSRRA